MKEQYRQGDVLIEKINSIPKKLKKEKAKKIILAEGEATGHAHTMDINDADWWKNGDEQVVSLKKEKALVKHEEHKPIELPLGDYQIIRQREYHPTMKERKVED